MEGATTVLHINSTGFFSRNQLELEASPALYQRPRNCNQWMPRLAMLHALHEQTLWASGSSSSDSPPALVLVAYLPWTMLIHTAPSLTGLVHCPIEEVGSKDPPLFPRRLMSSSHPPRGWSEYRSRPHSWRSQVDQLGRVPAGSQPAPVHEHT